MTYFHEYDRPVPGAPLAGNTNRPYEAEKSSGRGLVYTFLVIVAILGGIAMFSGSGTNTGELLQQSSAIFNGNPHQ